MRCNFDIKAAKLCNFNLNADTCETVISQRLVWLLSSGRSLQFSVRTGPSLAFLVHLWCFDAAAHLPATCKRRVDRRGRCTRQENTFIYLHFSHYNRREAETAVIAAPQSRVSHTKPNFRRGDENIAGNQGLGSDRWTNLTESERNRLVQQPRQTELLFTVSLEHKQGQ